MALLGTFMAQAKHPNEPRGALRPSRNAPRQKQRAFLPQSNGCKILEDLRTLPCLQGIPDRRCWCDGYSQRVAMLTEVLEAHCLSDAQGGVRDTVSQQQRLQK